MKLGEITTKEVKFVNDPKNLSALEKIRELSDKAKARKSRKSPTHYHHIQVEQNIDANNNIGDGNFARRKSHFATMRYSLDNVLNNKFDIPKKENMRKSYVNNNSKGIKKEYVWDKKINRLVEKNSLDQIDENEEHTKEKPEVKKGEKKSEKSEILKKLKDYKASKDNDSGKKKELVYEKKIVQESEEIEDNDYDDKNIVGSKNTKIIKKVVKDENGSRVIIKKIVEEISEPDHGEKLVFEEESDDEDLEKEIKNIENEKNDNNNMKYEIIKEKFDPKGNKIYSKEILTNKKPKGM